MTRPAICVTLAAFVLPVATQTVVTDGDTIKFGGTIYRLWGIDAPETHQSCPDGWPAGRIATDYTRMTARARAARMSA